MSRLLARGVVVSPLPDLQAADNRTKSHALHDDAFIGQEEDWTDFFDEAMNYFNSTPWDKHDKVISYRPGPNAAATIFEEHVPCGDEATVPSRFIQNISEHMNAICKAAHVDNVIGDYKSCTANPVTGVPDIAVRTSAGELNIPGEMKAWWILEHNLRMGKASKSSSWKRLLGWWFLKTFAEVQQANINFKSDRQIHEASRNEVWLLVHIPSDCLSSAQDMVDGKWCLFVSDVVAHNAKSGPSHPTVRQCFWYILNRPATEYHVNNDTLMSQWVQDSYWDLV